MSQPDKAEIRAALKANRPNLSDSSLTTYGSLINSAMKAIGLSKVAEIAGAKEAMLNSVENGMTSKQSKKTLLSALLLITGDESYRAPMLQLLNETNREHRLQKKNPKCVDSYISFEQVKDRRLVQAEQALKASPIT
jgi:hypothetical protein